MHLTSQLYNTLEVFCSIFPRQYDFGKVIINNTKTIKSNSDFELLGEAMEYYSLVSIEPKTMIGGNFSLTLCPFENIRESLQGWRWNNRGENATELQAWKKSWIPLGDIDGSILFVKSELKDKNVYGSFTGGFEPFLLSDNIVSFFKVLTLCMKIEMNEFNYEILDEDFAPKEEYIKRIEDVIANNLSEESREGFMKFFGE